MSPGKANVNETLGSGSTPARLPTVPRVAAPEGQTGSPPWVPAPSRQLQWAEATIGSCVGVCPALQQQSHGAGVASLGSCVQGCPSICASQTQVTALCVSKCLSLLRAHKGAGGVQVGPTSTWCPRARGKMPHQLCQRL